MPLTQPLEWKLGKFLEWRTYLLYENRPQFSPDFVIKNIHCYFQLLSRKTDKNYHLLLKPKSQGIKLEPFSLTIYFRYSESYSPHIYPKKFTDSNKHIFSFPETYFTSMKLNLSHDLSVRFLFAIEQNVGLWLLSESKTDEKCIQTDETVFAVDEKFTQADFLMSLQTDEEDFFYNFGELLKTGNHADVQLLCKGGNIPSHKAILAARSEAFSDIFQNNSEENKSGLINLTTTDKSVMELCLEFIYKGKILNLPVEKASDLYVLGNHLKISSLTRKCADFLISNLCEDNYVSYFVLADKYDDKYFKCGLTDYISDHVYLLKSENWMKFSDEHMKTAIEVYKKCMVKLI